MGFENPIRYVGDTVNLSVGESDRVARSESVDLWVAVQIPSKELLFFTTPTLSTDFVADFQESTQVPATLFSVSPQAFKRNTDVDDRTHHVLNFKAFNPDTYTLYALYMEKGKNPLVNFPNEVEWRSNLATATLTIVDSTTTSTDSSTDTSDSTTEVPDSTADSSTDGTTDSTVSEPEPTDSSTDSSTDSTTDTTTEPTDSSTDSETPDPVIVEPPEPGIIINETVDSSVDFSEESLEFSGILEAHNALRREVGLSDLGWSSEIEQVAQNWANVLKDQGCEIDHNPERYTLDFGENIIWFSGFSLTPQEVVDVWSAEKEDFDPLTGLCAPDKTCGHYTQIVWRDTIALGCGKAECGFAEIWVCNYSPAGNVSGEKPF